MDLDPWMQRWNDGRIGFHRADVHPLLAQFWPTLDLRGDELVFVPLCGKTLDLVWLAERGHRVRGVEISPRAAEAFFDERGESPERSQRDRFTVYFCGGIEIWAGDFFDLRPEHLEDVEAIYDRASIVALDRVTRPEYAAHLAAIVPAGARGLLIALSAFEGDVSGPPFSVSVDELGELLDLEFERHVLVAPDRNDPRGPEIGSLYEHLHRITRRRTPRAQS